MTTKTSSLHSTCWGYRVKKTEAKTRPKWLGQAGQPDFLEQFCNKQGEVLNKQINGIGRNLSGFCKKVYDFYASSGCWCFGLAPCTDLGLGGPARRGAFGFRLKRCLTLFISHLVGEPRTGMGNPRHRWIFFVVLPNIDLDRLKSLVACDSWCGPQITLIQKTGLSQHGLNMPWWTRQ